MKFIVRAYAMRETIYEIEVDAASEADARDQGQERLNQEFTDWREVGGSLHTIDWGIDSVAAIEPATENAA